MSLKIEQKIIGSQITDFEPTIYTTVAHLIPLKVNINGNEKYIWVVTEFNDDIFFNGEICTPHIIADSKDKLFLID